MKSTAAFILALLMTISLGAQNALLGGGRYDGLIRDLGGPDVPGFGFAVGEERLVMALPSARPVDDGGPDVFIAGVGEGTYKIVYTVVALAGLALICWGFSQYRADGWIQVEGTRHLA